MIVNRLIEERNNTSNHEWATLVLGRQATEQGMKYERDQAYEGKERSGGQCYVVAHPIE